MAKSHNRKLGLSGIAMTKARLPRHTIEIATEVRDKIEGLMISSGYLAGAPFEWVTVSLRYGLKNGNEPVYGPVNRKYGDLPLAIELDTEELMNASRDEMATAFEIAVLKALVNAGRKFKLTYAELEERLET